MLRLVSSAVFYLGLLLFLVAMMTDLRHTKVEARGMIPPTSLTERNLAIQKAQQEGKTDYSFTTNFVPTIGYPPQKSESK